MMRAEVIDEPPLEFGGGGRHVDPRFGLTAYGPADLNVPSAPTAIRIGLVGPADQLDGLRRWLERCREPIPAKDERYPHLFPSFPGCDIDRGLYTTLVFSDRNTRQVPDRPLRALANRSGADPINEAVDLYVNELAALAEENRVDLIVVARPDQLQDTRKRRRGRARRSRPDNPTGGFENFHDLLKARMLHVRQPLQIVRRSTWDEATPPPPGRARQDEASRAWNLHIAMYYKAGGVPWRLPRPAAELTTCFVGISFYRGGAGTSLDTAVAHVFNERGDGVIVRGGAAHISKEDKQPHLNATDAHNLLQTVLDVYRREHQTLPARVVIHKSSSTHPTSTTALSGPPEASSSPGRFCGWRPRTPRPVGPWFKRCSAATNFWRHGGAFCDSPTPLEPANEPQASVWIELHRRFASPEQTVRGSLALLRKFGPSEDFNAYVLTAMMAPGSASGPLPPDLLAEFHQELEAYFTRWPDSPHFRRVRISSEDPELLLEQLTEMVRPSPEEMNARRKLIDDIRAGAVPLIALAVFAGRTYAETLIHRGAGVIPAHSPDEHETAVSLQTVHHYADKDVVIEPSALVVLNALPPDVRHPALSLFNRITTTDDVLRDIREYRDTFTQNQVGWVTYDPAVESARPVELTGTDRADLAGQVNQLFELITSLRRVQPPPRPRLDGRAHRFAPLASVIHLAAHDVTAIWSDDTAARALARSIGIAAFSTPAVLHHLAHRNIISPVQHERAHRAMIAARIGDLPLDRRRLLDLARAEQWEPKSVALAFCRPQAWTNPLATGEVFSILLMSVRNNRPDAVAAWLNCGVFGAVLTARQPYKATRLAAWILTTSMAELDPDAELAAQLVTATRNAVTAALGLDLDAALDPLPATVTGLRDHYTNVLGQFPDQAARHVLQNFDALDESDRHIVTATLLSSIGYHRYPGDARLLDTLLRSHRRAVLRLTLRPPTGAWSVRRRRAGVTDSIRGYRDAVAGTRIR